MMEHSLFARRVLGPAQSFLHTEEIGAVALFLATLAALVWANSPWSESYGRLLGSVLTLDLGVLTLSESLVHWVNDGLMAIFFFVVGLEIKREIVHGELAAPRKAVLPLLAAVGGMAVPGILFLTFNAGTPEARGWPVPMATDIAFAVGVLALVGRGLPGELRVFLLALAVADDLGAIMIIALFYTESLNWAPLVLAGIFLFGIVAAQRLQVRQVPVYVVLGVLSWLSILYSGIHATIAGVALGLLTPATPYLGREQFAEKGQQVLDGFRAAVQSGDHESAATHLGQIEELTAGTESPLDRVERMIHPWTSLVILPIFALANAGIPLSTGALQDAISSPVTLGVFSGLLFGKVVGIVGATWLAVRLGIGALPRGVTWRHVTGIGLLGGIGFTVSIFLAGLAFEDPTHAKIGILGASTAAAVLGYGCLRLVASRGTTANIRTHE